MCAPDARSLLAVRVNAFGTKFSQTFAVLKSLSKKNSSLLHIAQAWTRLLEVGESMETLYPISDCLDAAPPRTWTALVSQTDQVSQFECFIEWKSILTAECELQGCSCYLYKMLCSDAGNLIINILIILLISIKFRDEGEKSFLLDAISFTLGFVVAIYDMVDTCSRLVGCF